MVSVPHVCGNLPPVFPAHENTVPETLTQWKCSIAILLPARKKKRMLFSKSCQAKGALIHGDSQARCCLFLAADVKLCFSLFIVCLASVNTFLSYMELFTFSNLVMPLRTILFPRHQKNNQICLFPWRERQYVSIEILNREQTWRILFALSSRHLIEDSRLIWPFELLFYAKVVITITVIILIQKRSWEHSKGQRRLFFKINSCRISDPCYWVN